MRLTPTTPRELGINYVSQWNDSVIYLNANDQIPWLDSTYPYSRADQRALNIYNTGVSLDQIITNDSENIITNDGQNIITGGTA